MNNQHIGDDPRFASSASVFELQSFYSNNLPSQKIGIHPQLLGMLEGDGTMIPSLGSGVDCSTRSCSQTLEFDPNGDNVQSRDTLQSLVQSCSCGNRGSIRSPTGKVQECKHHPPRQNKLSFEDNNGVENYYSSKFQQGKQHQEVNFNEIKFASNNVVPEMKHKTRIRWTEDLHKKFIESVDRLGGAKKATPKAILKLMNCNGLTIFHIKSHLQKYRIARLIPKAREDDAEQLDTKTGMQIVEALRLQLDVQRRLYQQLESQKKLQMRIEEQVKQLRTMLQTQLNAEQQKTLVFHH